MVLQEGDEFLRPARGEGVLLVVFDEWRDAGYTALALLSFNGICPNLCNYIHRSANSNNCHRPKGILGLNLSSRVARPAMVKDDVECVG